MRLGILFACVFLGLSSGIQAKDKAKKKKTKNDLTDVQIVSADKLSYQDGNSILTGNVQIKLGKYIISAPRVTIESDKNGDASLARFINGSELNSEGLNITAPEMQMDINKSLFKCLSNPEHDVITTLENKKHKRSMIVAGYQELDFNTNIGKSLREGGRVKYSSDDLEIESDTIELNSKDGDVVYVDFIGRAIAIDPSQRTEAREIIYFPQQDIVKANDEVKILYIKDDEASHLFGDLIVYERKLGVIGAYSKSLDSQAEIHRTNAFGKARQIVLNLDDKQKPSLAILTGNAYAQQNDKSIVGDEILFDLVEQNMKTLVGRPKTQILKKKK
ncbi:MAG: hypothetical protein LW817_05590 [Candidatus Caenarcaniphilales bacterium]|jgi:lipopolysaccharide export system protein LptA|nr:hypothetical protein [Candidatus Caenarcaniphilales bacterium]